MALIPFLSNIKAWTQGRLPEPWQAGSQSIFDFIASNMDPETGRLPESAQTLPDESKFDQNELRFAPGAFEGAFGHHGHQFTDDFIDEADPAADALDTDKVLPAELTSMVDDTTETDDNVEMVFAALLSALKNPSKKHITVFYNMLVEETAFGLIDQLMDKISSHQSLDHDRLFRLSHWFALNAPDRDPVKIAIAFLGMYRDETTRDVFLTLGRHDEFTLYAAVALQNSQEDSEMALWELARILDGWGRIQTLERLSDTQNPEIKRWMVREGFRNSVMNEYLAYICATTGGLVDELRADDVDDELITGAGEIIAALIMGGPAEDMSDYADGAEAAELFLCHAENGDLSLQDFLSVAALHEFASGKDQNWAEYPGVWPATRRKRIIRQAARIMSPEDWKDQALAAMKSPDNWTFWKANAVAKAIGIDTWELVFERQQNTKDANYLYELMNVAKTPERVERVVAYAETTLPLAEVATGPADELGMGPGYQTHEAIATIVQELGRFPGTGWALINASLLSPVVRNRHMALKALADWGQDNWPPQARSTLEAARDAEPREDTKERMTAVLDGRSWDDS